MFYLLEINVGMARDLILLISSIYDVLVGKNGEKVAFLFQNLCFLIKCCWSLHGCVVTCSTSSNIKITPVHGLTLLISSESDINLLSKLLFLAHQMDQMRQNSYLKDITLTWKHIFILIFTEILTKKISIFERCHSHKKD